MKDLQGDEHVFRMGHYKQPFRCNFTPVVSLVTETYISYRIKWHPVVLSFVFPSKDTKGGKDPLIPIRSRLEDLDIKTVIPFIPDKTTHVVASKRNTAKGLQALINAKFVVGNDFLDALEYATKPENLDELESFSPLEENFDQFWPKEQEYLPPPSKEPGQHSSKAFSPDQARKNIFRGYTFVFFDLTQFESLQPPITDGGGKTLFFPIEKGVTTAIEIVGRIKEAADEKAVGDSRDGGEGKCPVHVQFPGGKGFENWAATVQTEASVIIGQRLIGQNEFLEAILTNDASRLRQRIPIEDVMDTSGPPTGSGEPRPPLPTQSARNTPQAAESATRIRQESSEPSPPQSRPAQTTSMPSTRRVRPRGTIVSAFKGFDDGFEPTQVPQQKKFTQVNSQTSNDRSGLSQVAEDEEMRTEIYSEAEDQPVSTRAFKKRPLPSDDEDDDNGSLLPAAAAMKKLRVEEENDARHRGVSVEPTFGSKTIRTTPPPKPKPKRQKKEVDIQEAVRTRREAADEAAQRDEESLRQTLDDMSVEEMKALAVVEEIEVAEREPLAQRANAQTDRWDERWNGRKNFKKFRRQGDSGPAPRRGQTVIVPLEEVRKNGQSIVPQPANSHTKACAINESGKLPAVGRRRLPLASKRRLPTRPLHPRTATRKRRSRPNYSATKQKGRKSSTSTRRGRRERGIGPARRRVGPVGGRDRHQRLPRERRRRRVMRRRSRSCLRLGTRATARRR